MTSEELIVAAIERLEALGERLYDIDEVPEAERLAVQFAIGYMGARNLR